LWIKIVLWIPIFSVLLIMLYTGPLIAGVIVGATVLAAVQELRSRGAWHNSKAIIYAMTVLALFSSLVWFWALPITTTELSGWILCICFASALSDVAAYFAGNYLGKHPLPSTLNNRKSWEGVVGQIIGGVGGLILTRWVLDVNIEWELGLLIGAASAIGDLANSYVKRSLAIKDWGNTIPGHGGVLDRFSSLSVALATALIYLALTR
jgi:phosphatidate cytidylyltransferase